MTYDIIKTIITLTMSAGFGYVLNTLKNYKKETLKERENEKLQNQALVMLIQNTLTNTYFVYSEIGKIPDYVQKNWTNLAKIYKLLGGNDYMHVLEEKMKKWEIVKTDILK